MKMVMQVTLNRMLLLGQWAGKKCRKGEGMITTTLNEIRKQWPCSEGWEKALRALGKTGPDNEPLTLLKILEINGFEDAIWALRCIESKYDNATRLFACFCARYVLDIFEREYPNDNRPRKAIEVAERFAYGFATERKLAKVSAAALGAAQEARHGDTMFAACAAAEASEVKASPWTAVWSAFWAAGPGEARRDTHKEVKQEFVRLCKLEDEYGAVTKMEGVKND